VAVVVVAAIVVDLDYYVLAKWVRYLNVPFCDVVLACAWHALLATLVYGATLAVVNHVHYA
jgi:hypothetical protein